MIGYGIAPSTMFFGSYFLFGDWGQKEIRFTMDNGKPYRIDGWEFAPEQYDFIVKYFNKRI
jgi:hypothetical protein